jgi:hypothetical protein
VSSPIPNSYWVLPGRLLAGEHPHGGDAPTARQLGQLVAAGVREFIDLTRPGEVPSYVELLPPGTGYRNFPLPDHSVPQEMAQMRELQQQLARLLVAGGGAVYVHCRAGIGRTGITIGCWLRERGLPPQAALDELNKLWRQNARAARWPKIPETPEQEAYILDWPVEARDAIA